MPLDDSAPDAPELSVLVIDDEDYVADMIASALELEGYHVDVAYNGRDGLQSALVFRGQAMIVDIMMPYMSGVDLVEQLRQTDQPAQIPIVLISAGARPRRMMPNVAFLPKPFNLDELLRLVREQVQPSAREDQTP